MFYVPFRFLNTYAVYSMVHNNNIGTTIYTNFVLIEYATKFKHNYIPTINIMNYTLKYVHRLLTNLKCGRPLVGMFYL